MSKVFGAKVKNVLSGDTLVLSANSSSSQERLLSLAYIQAPRSTEPFAYESKEILRSLLVGKDIKFHVSYKSNSGREFGDVSTPLFKSLAEYVVAKGGAKVRDNINDEEAEELKIAETKAKAQNLGIWDPKLKSVQTKTSLAEAEVNLKTQYPAIVEKVVAGDRLIVRILVHKTVHVVIPVLVAGIRTPRTASNDQPAEPLGEQAFKYVESRLLARSVKVTLIGESSTGVAIGKIVHPAGNITDKLLQEGLAEVVDWQSTLVGPQGMSYLRGLEKTAKAEGKGIWKSSSSAPSSNVSVSSNASKIRVGAQIEAVVSRIVSSDTLVIRLNDDTEHTVQLSSLRAPRQSDASSAAFVPEAREFTRKTAIGKHVKVFIDAVRPKSEQFDERFLVSITLPNGKSLSSLVVSSGYATVIRHRRGDEDRSPDWDSLIEEEATSIKDKKGIHGKAPKPERIVDASENAARAKQYLTTLQSKTSIPALVEHVSSATRFRLVLPRDGIKITLVLGGLAALNRESEVSKKALSFVSKKAYQRDVHVSVYGVDKVGGFIGNLVLPGQSVPIQASLVSEGYAAVHERSVNQTGFGSLLTEAENEAKTSRLGIWSDYNPSAIQQDVQEVTSQLENITITKRYLDVELTDISEEGLIAYQIVGSERSKLSSFMKSFHDFHSSNQAPLAKQPQKGDIVSAQFSENKKYYRAKIISFEKASREYKVQHIDYGNYDVVPLASLRSLPAQFAVSAFPAQAHTAQLSLITLPPQDYLNGAIDFIEELTAQKGLVACETFRNPAPGVESDVILYDPKKIASDPNYSINKEVVENGWGIVKKHLKGFEKGLESEWKQLLEVEASAKAHHRGCWEYGDIESDQE
ncbi:unnamed protein product [Kuraishia capsulata CBS 1993]|uniref:Uncharacterized protein n=1 Tax=Kuraishia capsulata CBS 1993 TaxID=1382522 RepID=W6MPU1_9ASCO|nr:uncharacterized protein KUCA_T00003174001 [Kuraishia capsulata CBS 1993]CDK27197.1 unnamed protein product [Kuraishia capsulata CBS 1993]